MSVLSLLVERDSLFCVVLRYPDVLPITAREQPLTHSDYRVISQQRERLVTGAQAGVVKDKPFGASQQAAAAAAWEMPPPHVGKAADHSLDLHSYGGRGAEVDSEDEHFHSAKSDWSRGGDFQTPMSSVGSVGKDRPVKSSHQWSPHLGQRATLQQEGVVTQQPKPAVPPGAGQHWQAGGTSPKVAPPGGLRPSVRSTLAVGDKDVAVYKCRIGCISLVLLEQNAVSGTSRYRRNSLAPEYFEKLAEKAPSGLGKKTSAELNEITSYCCLQNHIRSATSNMQPGIQGFLKSILFVSRGLLHLSSVCVLFPLPMVVGSHRRLVRSLTNCEH